MKIASSQVVMKSLSEYKEYQNVQTSLHQWKDAVPQGDHLTLSSGGLAKLNSSELVQSLLTTEFGKTSSMFSPLESIPNELTDEEIFSEEDLKKIRLLERMLESLLGKKFKFSHIGLKKMREMMNHPRQQPVGIVHAPSGDAPPPASQPAAPERVGWGINFKYSETHYTYESTTFSAAGKIQVEDGRQIEFSLNLHMSRETYSQFELQYKAGDALIDPIVLRLDEMPLSMNEDAISFDLDVDGQNDKIHVPIGNAGILFFDRNNNGSADDGSELFGPTSGNGYSELQSLDEDHNGWLDENDEAFRSLKLWIRSPEGDNKYLGLIEAGVGALFVSGTSTAFDLYTESNEFVGKMRETGVYLHEDGSPGLMHEIDLKI